MTNGLAYLSKSFITSTPNVEVGRMFISGSNDFVLNYMFV